jgi:hypothetical protein
MRRFIVSTTVALGCAFTVAIHAQDTTIRSKTKVSGGDAKVVTYTGCVQNGTETQSYILEKAVPVSRTTRTEIGTAGPTTSTTTTYMLIPGEKVELQKAVGHKVEVTGVMMPAGDVKSRTETKIEREHAKDTKITEESKTKNAMPQFRVTSVKHLAESC